MNLRRVNCLEVTQGKLMAIVNVDFAIRGQKLKMHFALVIRHVRKNQNATQHQLFIY